MSSNSQQAKITIKTSDLKERVKQYIERITEKNEDAIEEHRADVLTWETNIINLVNMMRDQTLQYTFKYSWPWQNYSGLTWPPFPPVPVLKEVDLTQAKNDLSLLELSLDETIQVSTNGSWGKYL